MQRQIDECRAFLESYREALAETDRLIGAVQRLDDQARKVTATITGMPSGGGADKDAVLAALADARNNVVNRFTWALKRKEAVEDFIDEIPDMTCRVILRLRYIERLKWPQIIERLEDSPYAYSERAVFVIHGRALNEARRIWSERKEEFLR